ncbi:MAG: hypothetical protein AAF236_16610, partial [Verrucomicrobiota bacterium]
MSRALVSASLFAAFLGLCWFFAPKQAIRQAVGQVVDAWVRVSRFEGERGSQVSAVSPSDQNAEEPALVLNSDPEVAPPSSLPSRSSDQPSPREMPPVSEPSPDQAAEAGSDTSESVLIKNDDDQTDPVSPDLAVDPSNEGAPSDPVAIATVDLVPDAPEMASFSAQELPKAEANSAAIRSLSSASSEAIQAVPAVDFTPDFVEA